jgi:plasmid stabilization system protein ParE
LEKSKNEVIFLPKSQKSIFSIYRYIAERGYPATAEKFFNRLYDFGYGLNDYPDKYGICRQPVYQKRKLHCAVFESNYVFIYKAVKSQLVIYNIIHSKRLK